MDQEKNEITTNIFSKALEKDDEIAKKDDVRDLVQGLHKQAVVSSVENIEEYQEKFIAQAKKSIDAELDTLDQENTKRRQQATYNANEEACKNYGVNVDVPLWQIRLMKFGSGVWFVIYWIFATLTIAPISIFFKGLQSFIKSSWLVFIFALICYLLIVVGIPLLISLLTAIP